MTRKRHGPSVTSEPCGCSFLERASAEPRSVICYDEELGEYQIRHPAGGWSGPIYHCPFCGGLTPESKRAALFASVTWAEVARLEALTAGISSIEDAIERFGPAQSDRADGMKIQTPASD